MTRDEITKFVAELVAGYDMEPEDAAALHEMGKLAALRAPAVTGEAASVTAFVERCEEIRLGSPNAFYAHVDKFCKAWRAAAPPAAGAPPALVALVQDLAERLNVMIRHRHEEAHNGDIYRGGSYEACPLCAETRAVIGRASAWSPAPAPVAPPAETLRACSCAGSCNGPDRLSPAYRCAITQRAGTAGVAPNTVEVPFPPRVLESYRRTLAEAIVADQPAPLAVAGGDVKLARGEMPSSATWGDLGRAAKCSRCGDDGRPCSHCE